MTAITKTVVSIDIGPLERKHGYVYLPDRRVSLIDVLKFDDDRARRRQGRRTIAAIVDGAELPF